MENFKEYGVVGILVLLILKEVFAFVKVRMGSGPTCPNACKFKAFHATQVEELHEWHKPDPETGRFSWYERDGEIIAAVARVGEDLVRELREFRKDWKNGH